MLKFYYESDYGYDSLRWIQKREELPKIIKTDDLNRLQAQIIKDKDIGLAYFFASDFNFNPHLMRNVILESKSARYAYIFAQNIKNCDILALQKIVVESRNIKYICKFACFIPGADHKLLENLVLKSKNAQYAHMFLKHVKGANIRKFKQVILDSKKPRYLFELAKKTNNIKELSKIEDLIIESNSFTYMKMFAEKIRTANIEKIERAVLNSNNINEIKKFAQYVKKSNLRKFLLVN